MVSKRSLGQTSTEVTPIGLGVMQFAGGQGMIRHLYPSLSPAEMNAIVKTALDGGINWFDTAESYGKGMSEQGLAQALHAAGKSSDEVVIATKWWPLFRTASNMRRNIKDRLRYLDGFEVDLYQIHWPWSFSSPENEMQIMADLVRAGKTRAVGVSNFSADRMRRAHSALAERGLALASNQVPYSLLDRQIEDNGVLEAAKQLGVTIICWSPLNSGVLSGKHHRNPDLLDSIPPGRQIGMRRQIKKTRPLVQALDEIASDRGVTIAQVALNWLVNFHGETVVAIPGATNPKQAAENAGAMRFTLSDDEMHCIDRVSRQSRSVSYTHLTLPTTPYV